MREGAARPALYRGSSCLHRPVAMLTHACAPPRASQHLLALTASTRRLKKRTRQIRPETAAAADRNRQPPARRLSARPLLPTAGLRRRGRRGAEAAAFTRPAASYVAAALLCTGTLIKSTLFESPFPASIPAHAALCCPPTSGCYAYAHRPNSFCRPLTQALFTAASHVAKQFTYIASQAQARQQLYRYRKGAM
mgnify:CR=1 FL=1